jgi:hypothetical protein
MLAKVGRPRETRRMAHLTTRLGLGLTQHEIDFVDVKLDGDTPLFIDPYFLGLKKDAWSISASKTIRSFFNQFLNLIRNNREREAFDLFSHLGEPNETCLGLSRGRSQGRGVGRVNSEKIFDSLKQSKAIQTGIVEHLEDCRLFVEDIDKDKTSDMATNIIRGHLIEYTQTQCNNYNIPLTTAPSGFMWDRVQERWNTTFTEMLVIDGRKILLVPKGIVSFSSAYTSQQYHQHFILNFLQHEHLRLGSVLVEQRKLKNGRIRRFVTKKKLKEEVAPLEKSFITDFTAKYPDTFALFKAEVARPSSLTNESLTRSQLEPVIEHLIAELSQIPKGADGATRFHKTVTAILELLFYPKLVAPEIEVKIHDGRKRIDIVYDNAASSGFFWNLHNQYQTPCQFIFVECKNYSSDPRNPELDQMGGRFSPNKGKFGIIVCRSIDDETLFLKRCADTYRDQRGVILPLTDENLIVALKNLRDLSESKLEDILQAKFRIVALS